MGTHMPGNAAGAQKKDSGGIKVQKKIRRLSTEVSFLVSV